MPPVLTSAAAAPARAPQQAAVATAFPDATDAALDILARGGNAVDAAVAAAWALAVCEPSASGIGGQALLLLRRADGDVRVYDGHSHAPRRASTSTVGPDEQRRGPRACTVPSMPATLARVHRLHGRLAWREVLAPAAHLAADGFPVTALLRRQIGWVARCLREDAAASAIFLPEGEPPRIGALLRQPRLAETLLRLSEHGAEDLYRGALARDLADDMRAQGGLVDEEDLATFRGPVQREPMSARFRGVEVLTAPPPAGGLTLLDALTLLERLLPDGRANAPEERHEAVALAILGAFELRERRAAADGGLPAVRALPLAPPAAAELAAALTRGVRPHLRASEEPGDTTHLTVADAEGNVVSLTQSIQSVFGAKVASGRLGFLYNNYLKTCPRHAHPARLAPGCPSRSNASPALVLGDPGGARRPLLAMGSAGSRRIVSSLAQVAANVVDLGMAVEDAIAAPRVHAVLGGAAWVERPIATPALLERLGRRFARVLVKGDLAFTMGAVHALEFLPGATRAGADPRRDGTAAALPRTDERTR